jgi:arylformamidase
MPEMCTYDISPEISEALAVFPGDTPFRRKTLADFKTGDALVLSTIEASVHLGAHTDAPNHYHPEGSGIAERSLDLYLGDCQVIRVQLPRGERIRPEHLGDTRIQAKRVLFHTGSYPDPNRWNGDFNALSAELIAWLAARGVILVGIDTPSVDLADDGVLEAHRAIYAHDLAILEGIVLTEVPPGIYELIALPLKLEGFDASPVRAVLRVTA